METEKRQYRTMIGLIVVMLLIVAVIVAIYSAPSFPAVAATVAPTNIASSSESYLVVLSSGNDHSKDMKQISDVESFLNLSPDCRYNHSVKGFACRMTPSQLDRIKSHPAIASIERDIVVRTMQFGEGQVHKSLPIEHHELGQLKTYKNGGDVQAMSQIIPWGITRAGCCSNAYNLCNGVAGSPPDVDVYVVDTGIDYKHPELNVVSNRAFITTAERSRGGLDLNGHGTHVAGIIGARDNATGVVGVCPGVRLHAIKVLDSKGSGYLSWILAGLDYVASIKQQNPTKKMVVNMSLGATTNAVTSMDVAVRRLINLGVTCCIAAGNEATSTAYSSPGHVSEAITVGAYASNNTFASFSNYGSLVDILAPGVGILSTYPNSRYATLSGTSMATPHVTGGVALLLGTGSYTPAQVRAWLISNATSNTNVQNNPIISGVRSQTTNISLYVS